MQSPPRHLLRYSENNYVATSRYRGSLSFYLLIFLIVQLWSFSFTPLIVGELITV